MAGSVNKVILLGNLGRDPEVKETRTGGKIVTFSVATSESWKDKKTGERKEKTEWHNVVIYNEGLGKVAADFLKKGSKVYIEGSLASNAWTAEDGTQRSSTNVVLKQFNGDLVLIDQRRDGAPPAGNVPVAQRNGKPKADSVAVPELDDEIPF